MAIALLAGAGLGCAPDEQTQLVSSEATSTNGLRINGLRINGLRINGLRINGLRINGLRINGLATNADFVDWFNNADGGDRVFHDEVMRYLAGCALGPDQVTGYTDTTGKAYTWTGSLGLARTWFDAVPATDSEKQLVTACMMAHINTALPEPKNVMISVRGEPASLAATSVERSTMASYDGAFFGDMFAETQKMYLCRPAEVMPPNYTQTLLKDWGRQCYFTEDGCAGTFTLVDCATACTKMPAGGSYKWGDCTVDGKTYKSINVYLPKFAKARDFARVGSAGLDSSCKNCLDFGALNNLGPTGNGARISSWLPDAGAYTLQVRFANGNKSRTGAGLTGFLRVLVNGVPVMNGATDRWDFAFTGSSDTWQTRAIPVVLPAGATIELRGAGTTAPNVDSVAVRFQ